MSFDMETVSLQDDALRQYLDARGVFLALEKTIGEMAAYRGGMVWKTVKGRSYLIRTSTRGAQKSLGARTQETESIFHHFIADKARVTQACAVLRDAAERHRRMNKALRVGRAPDVLISILNAFNQAGAGDDVTVIDENALFAYETRARVCIVARNSTMRDASAPWGNSDALLLAAPPAMVEKDILNALQRVDASFMRRPARIYTVANKKGYAVIILDRAGQGTTLALPATNRLSDFWASNIQDADWLVQAPKFSEVIVGVNGRMACMTTVDPRAFALHKLWQARQPGRGDTQRRRDASQARIIVKLLGDGLAHFCFDKIDALSTVLADADTDDEDRPDKAL